MNGDRGNAVTGRILVTIAGLLFAGALSAQDREDSVGILRGINANWDVAALDAWINAQGSDRVAVGDKIEFHFRSAAVGYMSFAYIDSAGAAAVVVPSVDDLPELTVAGEEQVYPSPAAGFQFRAVAPAGTETAFVVLTDRPVRPSAIGEADEYGFLESDDAAGLLERYVAAINDVAEQGLVAVVEIEHASVVSQQAAVADEAGGARQDGGAEHSGAGEAVAAGTGDEPAGAAVASADAAAAPAETAAGDVTGIGDIGEAIAEATELPDLPDAPAVPAVPDAGDIEDATGLSKASDAVADATTLPGVPVDVPDTADIADATGVTALEEGVESATELPSLPDAPTMPTTGEVMTAAGVPDVPNVPDAAGVIPNVPDATDVIDIPDAPQVPNVTDIVDLPDVPDATDVVSVPDVSAPTVPDVKGNVLGRVMSQANSVPTSAAEAGTAAKQIATAAAARKVFNWAFDDSGSSRPASGEPAGVSGVIAELSADPDKMDALAEENPGAVGAIRMLGRSGDPDRQLALTLGDLEEEIENASEVYYCTSVSDCGAMPMGRNACGHAQKYVIYTSTTTDVGDLTAKIRDYDSYDTVRRMAAGTPEADCSVEAGKPRLICERNICNVDEDS